MGYIWGLRVVIGFCAALIFIPIMDSASASAASNMPRSLRAAIEYDAGLVLTGSGKRVGGPSRSLRSGSAVRSGKTLRKRGFGRKGAMRGPFFRRGGFRNGLKFGHRRSFGGVIHEPGKKVIRKSLRVSTPLRIRVGQDRPVLRRGGKGHRKAKWRRVQVSQGKIQHLVHISSRAENDRRVHKKDPRKRSDKSLYGAFFYDGYNSGGYFPSYKSYYAAVYAAKQHCSIRFESFDWETGLYSAASGQERLCPYLENIDPDGVLDSTAGYALPDK